MKFIRKHKVLIIIIALLLITLFGIIFWRKYRVKLAEKKIQEKSPNLKTTDTGGGAPPKDNNIVEGNDDYPLMKGSEGNRVKFLQEATNIVSKSSGGNVVLETDGRFGTKTYNAILLTFGTSFYPVTQEKYIEILKKAQ